MRILVFFLFFTSLFSSEYDDLLLRAQASMYPKIILLDKNINTKIIDNMVSLTIIYEKKEMDRAKKFKDMIDHEYNSKIGTYEFKVNLLSIKNFSDLDTSTAYYIFDTAGTNKKPVILHSIDNNRICFSYNYKDFNKGALISLFLKEKTYIYINKSFINVYSIKFVPIFYKIAKAI